MKTHPAAAIIDALAALPGAVRDAAVEDSFIQVEVGDPVVVTVSLPRRPELAQAILEAGGTRSGSDDAAQITYGLRRQVRPGLSVNAYLDLRRYDDRAPFIQAGLLSAEAA